MTLLIAVSDTVADRELVVSARCLAEAAGWDARAVHVREAGGPELTSAGAGDLEIVDLEGDAADGLAGLVGRADIDAIAVGLRTSAEPGIGHVTEALLQRPSAPLLLVRPGMRPLTTLRRLLVPLEGSPSASSAMRHADDALCKRGREIVMLHVVTKSTPDERGSFPAPRIVDQEHYEWAAWQDEFCMRFSQCPEGGRHRVCMRVGAPAATIVKEAQTNGAELIVLSWKGSFAEGHGAVVKKLLDTAPCPLLIVPAG
ncbi:MAG: universal stress protein [Actinobacteria bacterium]|nr:universal stress protein [Actinomycetota bacterium]